MSTLDRIGTILNVNINHLLSKAENPEKMCAYYIRVLDQGLDEGRKQMAEVLLHGRMLQSELDQAKRLTADWSQRAVLAADNGAVELAREALRRKIDYEVEMRERTDRLKNFEPTLNLLKRRVHQMETKRAEIERRRDTLLARMRVAKSEQRIQKALRPRATSGRDFLVELERKVLLEEARAEADQSFDASLALQFDDLLDFQREAQVEAELEKLIAAANPTTSSDDGPSLDPDRSVEDEDD